MPETRSQARPIIVVGAGWAGLSAAVELCRHGHPVLVLESARQAGGRARSVRLGDTIVDNGQHLMIGAYQSLLTLMQTIGADPDHFFERLPLTLRMLRGPATSLQMRLPGLPAPLHLVVGLLTARGLSTMDKWRAIRFGRRLPGLSITPEDDISVQALLHSEAQSPALIRKLWEPLCIAALNTPINIASARLFVSVLNATFSDFNRHSDLLIPKTELGAVLPRPAADYIERNGGHIELGQRVSALETHNGKLRAVRVNDRTLEVDRLILATPHVIARRLLSQHDATADTAMRLATLGHEPISTLYLQYPADTCLPFPMVALEDSLVHWLFDRRVCGQPGMMAVVISARGEHSHMPADTLTGKVITEISKSFPHWPAPLDTYLVREKRATFCAGVAIDRQRPTNRTALHGLWLAGDYTDTGFPATVEGAVISGIGCANAVLQESQH